MFEFARHPFSWLGRPVELPGSRRCASSSARTSARNCRNGRSTTASSALCFYHPDDPAALKKEQQEKLRALFEAARKVGRELLIEIIAGKNGPLKSRYGVDRAAGALRSRHQAGLVEAGAAGLERRVGRIEAVIAKHDPWCRGVLLGLDAPPEELEEGFAATAVAPAVKGFAVGRTIFVDARPRLAGRQDRRRGSDRRHGRPLPRTDRRSGFARAVCRASQEPGNRRPCEPAVFRPGLR
jgi:5-dehydro-2-deoxygluconokinase